MILLTAARIPNEIDNNTLAKAVEIMFPNPQNKNYIQNITDREDSSSVRESLFALALLYEQIRALKVPDCDTESLVFAKSKNGKPYFVNSAIKFNISHSKGYAVCAASVNEELGVDIEASNIPSSKAEKLAERYFRPDEITLIKSSPNKFTRIWSEKEAKAKFLDESIGNLLSNERNNANLSKDSDLATHNFSIDNAPISLCTKRLFSTIIFEIQ